MKIHHIIDDIVLKNGGAQRIAIYLHQGLLRAGIDSSIIALCGEVDEIDFARSFMKPSVYNLTSFFSVFQYIKNNCHSTDIIHAHLFPAIFYVGLSCRILGWKGKLVMTEHSTSNRRRGTQLGKSIDRQIYPYYDQIYCISEGTKEALGNWIPSQKDKCKVIENGTVLPFNSFQPRLNKKKLTIVSAGRLHKVKNYETILKGLSLLKDIDFEYRIAGLGEKEDSLKELCSKLSLNKKVNFCGYVENISNFFSEADIFVICSLWEGFGLAAVEAMNTGLPVIASNVPGLKEIVDIPNNCGVLISPDSPEEIAESVRFFLDSNVRNTYGKNGFERSLHFSIENMVDKYIRQYEQLYI